MLNKKQNILREALTVVLLLASVALAEYWFFQLWRLDWKVPMLYGGDGIYWVGQIQRSFGELTGSLGWPFYQAPSPYEPNYDLVYDIFVAFVGLFTKDTGTVFNLYILVIPFANALAGYTVFRMVGMRRWLSYGFGMTFGLCAYVQQRLGGHMMLAAVEFVPFSVLLCLWCAEDPNFNKPGKGFFKNKRNWLALAMAWGIANNGAAYYPYFTCFFLCVTALCLMLRDHAWKPAVPCLVTIGEIVAWMVPDFFPMVLGKLVGVGSTITNGVYRSPVGADIYSLRISSLLLSPNGFGIGKLARWIQRYFQILSTDEGPMYNENSYGYLGIMGIIGFLFLILMLLRNWDWKAGRTEHPELGDRVWLLSRLNVMALLLTTLAGFGSIIGIFIRFIRGYNRISPYIIFFALLTMGLTAEKRLTQRTGKSRAAFAAVLAVLLVFGSSMGSYPVPHYLGLTTLATKYVSMNSKYTGEASILAIVMMVFGVAIMLMNQMSLRSRKSYTTVTGKSGQISKINLGRAGKYVIALVLVVLTFFTSIFPIVSFAFETFLPNPGDYSFLYTGDAGNLTTKWWVTSENVTENGMYGQKGILHNETIWRAFRGTILVSVSCALLAGTIGTMIGYAVSKNRRSRWANYVNAMAFLPYLMPSIAVGVAFFILFSNQYINLFNTYALLIIVGTIKYIPFASRSSLNSMLQLSGEIEESAMILNIPWVKRMTRIIIPIQKSSIISGFLLPFMTCLRELSLFMLLCTQGFILSTTLDYFDEMGLYAFSSGINLILIVTILVCNTIVNKVTGASLDKGIGG